MDRPELREKIKSILYQQESTEIHYLGNRVISASLSITQVNDIADQILALYPDIEEAKHKQIRIKRKELFPHGHKDCFECENFVVDLAKREERERILDEIDELSNDGEFLLTAKEIRQALKGEDNEQKEG